MWQDFVSKFTLNFIKEDRWKFILRGLSVTIEITIFALIIGIVIGLLVALVKTTYENTGKLKIANAITNVYLTIIRGTPVVVQLMILANLACVNLPTINTDCLSAKSILG